MAGGACGLARPGLLVDPESAQAEHPKASSHPPAPANRSRIFPGCLLARRLVREAVVFLHVGIEIPFSIGARMTPPRTVDVSL